MAKVLGYIVIEEKGDAEHTKAISTPGIITNKAEYEMEPQKKEQTGIVIVKIVTEDKNIEAGDMVNYKVLKTVMFGTDYMVILACMIIIIKIVTEDENIEAGDMVNYKALKTLMFGTDYKVMLACMIIIIKIITEDKNIEAGDMVNYKMLKMLRLGKNKNEAKISEFDTKKKKPLMFGQVNEDGRLQLAEQPSVNNMLRWTSI